MLINIRNTRSHLRRPGQAGEACGRNTRSLHDERRRRVSSSVPTAITLSFLPNKRWLSANRTHNWILEPEEWQSRSLSTEDERDTGGAANDPDETRKGKAENS